MMMCPYNCGPCLDPSCRWDGCKQANETMPIICDGCGEPVGCVNCLYLCIACVEAPEEESSDLSRH